MVGGPAEKLGVHNFPAGGNLQTQNSREAPGRASERVKRGCRAEGGAARAQKGEGRSERAGVAIPTEEGAARAGGREWRDQARASFRWHLEHKLSGLCGRGAVGHGPAKLEVDHRNRVRELPRELRRWVFGVELGLSGRLCSATLSDTPKFFSWGLVRGSGPGRAPKRARAPSGGGTRGRRRSRR